MEIPNEIYYTARKNGILYLVSTEGKLLSQIGEGAYCQIYSYNEYKALSLLDVRVYTDRGVWKAAYIFDYSGKKIASLPYNSYIEPIAFENDTFLVTNQNNNGVCVSCYVMKKDGKKVILGTGYSRNLNANRNITLE